MRLIAFHSTALPTAIDVSYSQMCTENLTPVVKLLPCRGEVGMGALLHPTRIFAAEYYAINIEAEMERDKSSGVLKTLYVCNLRNIVFLDLVVIKTSPILTYSNPYNPVPFIMCKRLFDQDTISPCRWVRHSVQAVWAMGGQKGGRDRVSSITLYDLLVPRGLGIPNDRVNEKDKQVTPLFDIPNSDISINPDHSFSGNSASFPSFNYPFV